MATIIKVPNTAPASYTSCTSPHCISLGIARGITRIFTTRLKYYTFKKKSGKNDRRLFFADYDCTTRTSNLKSPGVVSGG